MPPPQRVPEAARRPADDARGAGRHGARGRGRGRGGDAALPLVRSCGERSAEAARARLLTPAVKYWVCKTAPALVYEAMECLGGNGYVEDGCWRGSIARRRSTRSGRARATSCASTCCAPSPASRGRARDAGRSGATSGRSARRGGAADFIAKTFADGWRRPARASPSNGSRSWRRPRRSMRSGRGDVAETFARTRLSGRRGATYGTSDLAAAETRSLLARVLPDLEPAHRCRDCAAFSRGSRHRVQSCRVTSAICRQEPRASKQRY